MPKKIAPPEDPKAQHQRFKETARETGADKNAREFENVFSRVVPPTNPQKKKPT